MLGTYGFFGAGGLGLRFRVDLGERFAYGLQRRGKRVTLCRKLAAGVVDEAVDFVVGQVERWRCKFMQMPDICNPLRAGAFARQSLVEVAMPGSI
jgi:hypothetical protein